MAPAAPPSDCISTTSGTLPHMFGFSAAAQSSACSAIGDAGVIGKIEMTSLTAYATRAAASLPSRHSHR